MTDTRIPYVGPSYYRIDGAIVAKGAWPPAGRCPCSATANVAEPFVCSECGDDVEACAAQAHIVAPDCRDCETFVCPKCKRWCSYEMGNHTALCDDCLHPTDVT